MRLLKRQLLSYFLILTLCLGMLPVTAAEEAEDDGSTQMCICDELCTEDRVNSGCPVCAADGADLSRCAGEGEREPEPSQGQESVGGTAGQSDGAEETHSHPVCGTSCSDGENHAAVNWTEWSESASMPDAVWRLRRGSLP